SAAFRSASINSTTCPSTTLSVICFAPVSGNPNSDFRVCVRETFFIPFRQPVMVTIVMESPRYLCPRSKFESAVDACLALHLLFSCRRRSLLGGPFLACQASEQTLESPTVPVYPAPNRLHGGFGV